MDATTELIYEGPPALTSALGQMLNEAGLEVDYDSPEETRSDGIGTDVIVGLIVTLGSDAAKSALELALARFRKRFPHAKVRGKHEK